MVRIRLQRHGAKKRPFYRVVAADKRSKRDGRFIELLGTYDPLHEPPLVRLNKERVDHWLSVGASPSETVRGLIAQLADGKAIDLSAEGAEAAARKAKAESRAQELAERREAAKKAHMEAAKAEEAAAAEAKQAEAAAAQEAAAAKEAAAQEAADAKEAAADAAPAEDAADAPAEETAEETASEDAE